MPHDFDDPVEEALQATQDTAEDGTPATKDESPATDEPPMAPPPTQSEDTDDSKPTPPPEP